MKITTRFTLGRAEYTLEVDEKDEMETLHKAIILSNPLSKCDECGDVGLDKKYLTTNKDKEGNTYVNVHCVCGAKSKLGQYKAGGYFWHRYETYNPEKKAFENA